MLIQTPPTKQELALHVKTYVKASVLESLSYLPPELRNEASEEIKGHLEDLEKLSTDEIYGIYWHTWCQPLESYCHDAFSMLFDRAFQDWHFSYMDKLTLHLRSQIRGLGFHRARQLRCLGTLSFILESPEEYHQSQLHQKLHTAPHQKPKLKHYPPGYISTYIPRKQLVQIHRLLSSWKDQAPVPGELIPRTASFPLHEIKDQPKEAFKAADKTLTL